MTDMIYFLGRKCISFPNPIRKCVLKILFQSCTGADQPTCLTWGLLHMYQSAHMTYMGALAQVPVFISAVWAVRHMAVTNWPGFDTGGTLWFGDLTLRALDLGSLQAPMGPVGVLLPGTVVLLMLITIDSSFGPLTQGPPGEPLHLYIIQSVVWSDIDGTDEKDSN